MRPFAEATRVVGYERRTAKSLLAGRSAELAEVRVDIGKSPVSVLLTAQVNWSVAFPAGTFTDGCWAEVTFELLRNKEVLYRIHQTAVQGENCSSIEPPSHIINCVAHLRHLDCSPAGKHGKAIYVLRATNIVAAALAEETASIITAAATSITLTAQLVEG